MRSTILLKNSWQKSHTHIHTHTLFKNAQQTGMNKMQTTITKEKLQHIHKNYNMKRQQLMSERLKTLELHCGRT